MKKMSTNLKQRLVASFLSILVIFIAIYLSHSGLFKLLFVSLTAAIIGTALWEFYHISKVKGYAPLSTIGISFSILYVFALFLSTQWPAAAVLPFLTLGFALVILFLYFFIKGTNPFLNISVTLFGIFYLTLPLACIIPINYFSAEDGRWWLFYVIAVTKMTDIGAYFFGKLFGSHLLVPYISPRKTWEGAIGGLLTAVAASWGFYALHLNLSLWQSLWLGISISFLAQFGDLAESLLKRDLGVKDSNQLPGLGGILDVLDSLVFTIPLIYIFLKMH